MEKKKHISEAKAILNNNLGKIARVNEWANFMGYEDAQKFSYCFVKKFGVRPMKAMKCIRLKSIIECLRCEQDYSNLEIARMHSLPEEKALNNFINYHTGHSPTQIQMMGGDEIDVIFQKFGNQFQE